MTRRIRVTLTLERDLVHLARTAVSRTPHATLAGLTTDGLRRTLRSLERARGRRFRPRPIRLAAGRPANHRRTR